MPLSPHSVVIYWALMGGWLLVLVPDDDSLTGFGGAGFGWHLLKYRRKMLRQRTRANGEL
jgi:hypothetical protein